MTLEEIKGLNKDWLTIEQMADFLGCDQTALRMQAKRNSDGIQYLGPVTIGNRTKFWRPAVIAHFERLINA